uniref:Uncharacterized protein n=1 Tax=Haemonchus contortus TaxID=6289 RepID=A0A7I4YW23_HAECO
MGGAIGGRERSKRQILAGYCINLSTVAWNGVLALRSTRLVMRLKPEHRTKKVRSFSPPPGYDTDPGCSTWRSSTAQFVDEPVSSQYFCLFNKNRISSDMCNKYLENPIVLYIPYPLRVLSIQIIIVMRQRNFQHSVNML